MLIDERSIKLTEKVDAIHLDLVRLTAAVGVTMKYVAGGVVVWAFKQVIELVQTFHH